MTIVRPLPHLPSPGVGDDQVGIGRLEPVHRELDPPVALAAAPCPLASIRDGLREIHCCVFLSVVMGVVDTLRAEEETMYSRLYPLRRMSCLRSIRWGLGGVELLHLNVEALEALPVGAGEGGYVSLGSEDVGVIVGDGAGVKGEG